MAPEDPIPAREARPAQPQAVGVVVIGRNEGERLTRSLQSVLACPFDAIVYVDSASEDGSPSTAREQGIDTVVLEDDQVLTAARGRNAGFQHLMQRHPGLTHVQFLDGDSAIDASWSAASMRVFRESPEIAVVCGRVRERTLRRGVFNRLMDIEWQTEPGELDSCGGIFMVRTTAFEGAGMFDPLVAAGEEADLCVRIRAQGGRVVGVDAPMATHDGGAVRFPQWWKRCIRNGRGYMSGVLRYGAEDGGHNRRRVRSCLVWGWIPPALVYLAAWLVSGWRVGLAILAALLVAAYGLQLLRIAWSLRRRDSRRDAWIYALFCMLGKTPESLGVLMGLMSFRRTARTSRSTHA